MTSYEKFTELCVEAEKLIDGVTDSSPEFISWNLKSKKALSKEFGEESAEMNCFNNIQFFSFSLTRNNELNHLKQIKACSDGLRVAIAIFKTCMENMEEEISEKDFTLINPDTPVNKSKVFIVHGHDSTLKNKVARLIERQKIEAIILSEQSNTGGTIIEKIENYSDVGAAICLFTNDDVGCEKSNKDENSKYTVRSRARQNVVFEAGYFIGKLGRGNVIIVTEQGIELPSDMQGVVYTDKSDYRLDILKELHAMGFSIDLNKLLK